MAGTIRCPGGMSVARGVLIADMADETAELSPTDWVRDQTRKILETGTTEGIEILGSPVVLLRLRGAKTGKLRYTPVMRVEHDGRYAVVASKGGLQSTRFGTTTSRRTPSSHCRTGL